MSEIAVIHLVRAANGLAPLARFLESYRTHPAGIDHSLVILLKGFPGRSLPGPYEDLLHGLPHERLFLPDRGFDIGPYFEAVRRLPISVMFFCNSFSRFLAPEWLAKMNNALRRQGVGAAGATGSYQSFTTAFADRESALSMLPFMPRYRARFAHVIGDRNPRLVIQRAGAWMLGAVGLWHPRRYFAEFPNYHLRTNAFIARRETLLRIRVTAMPVKLSALMFESGLHSFTRQIAKIGLKTVLVDRDGSVYDQADWHQADVFRQADQGKLLVADNQTDAYENATPEVRATLSRQAWRQFARTDPFPDRGQE